MQYTSELKRLVLPEYGRNVQQMVDHCMTIEDRAERTRCANTIINIMGNLFPHLRDIFSDLLDNRRIVFSGNGSTKCKDVIKHRNAIFVEGIVPLATDMLALAERAFRNGQFEDVAYFEPFYLKEFIATTPKNKIL